MARLRFQKRLMLLLVAPLLLWSCAQDQSKPAQVAVAENQAAQSGSASSLAPVDALAKENASGVDYRISARDIIDVTVFQVQELNKTVQVSEDGYISLPLVGKISVAGKSAQETEKIIGDKLKQKYLRSPQVSVFVKQYGQKVTVNGEVMSPKVLAIEGKLTLSQAIASAGGLGSLADTSRVHIARTRNQTVSDEVYNYNDILAGKVNDPVLQGGDLVVAEQSGSRVALKNVKDLLPFAIIASIL